MNMKKILPSLILLTVILAACGNAVYKGAMEEGTAAIEAGDYEKALGYFKEAEAETADDKEAKAAVEQTELMILAQEAIAEKGLKEALPYYEKIAGIEKGIDLLTDIAEGFVTEMTKVNEKMAEIEQLLDAGDKEAAFNVIDDLEDLEEDEGFFALVKAELDELKEEIQIDLLFSQIEGYAQKDDEIAKFCQIREDDLMCAVLTVDVYAYRDIVAIHLESEDSLRIETSKTDEADFVFSKITEDSFYINEQKYDLVTKEHVEKTGAELLPLNYAVEDIFDEELIKELEETQLGGDYFYEMEDKSDEDHVGTAKALQSYSDEEIEYARVWLDYYEQFGNSPPALTVEFWKKGSPVSVTFEEDSALFPEDVVVLTGEYTADGRLVYSSNGDGTINIYDIPSHWPGEYEMEGGVKAYTQKIADSPEKKSIPEGDIIEVLDVLEAMSVYR